MRPESAVPDSRDGVGPSGLQWVHPCPGKSTLSLGFSDLMSPSLVPGALTSMAKDSRECCCTFFLECYHQNNLLFVINRQASTLDHSSLFWCAGAIDVSKAGIRQDCVLVSGVLSADK